MSHSHTYNINGILNPGVLASAASTPGQEPFSLLSYGLLDGQRPQTTPAAPLEAQMANLRVDDNQWNTQSFLHQLLIQKQAQQLPSAPVKVDPSQIRWYYLDASNNEQGPFDSSLMQQWYSLRYFDYSLRIRRHDQASFVTLAEFIQSIGEYVMPFGVPLAPVAVQPAAPVVPTYPMYQQSQQPEPVEKPVEEPVPAAEAVPVSTELEEPAVASTSTVVSPEPVAAVEPLQTVKSEGLPPPETAPEPEKTKPQSPTVWAPWAAATPAKPSKTLEEIQAEEIELQREQERQAAAEKAAAAAKQPAAKQESKAAAGLPSTVVWGTGAVQPNAPVKSFEEIRNEEAAKMKAAAAASKAKPAAVSFAQATAGNGWTTVSAKKPVKTSVPVAGAKVARPAAITPTVLRSVSAPVAAKKAVVGSTVASPKPQPAPSNNSPSREFLVWCRTQLNNLHKGINKEDILSIIIQFPTGSESQEIIADTIYSNSATMDGRRFASEFLKRKAEVERLAKTQGLHFSWAEALAASIRGQEDDFDMAFTKVVSKKNRRKN
ncbi:hypothetical protein OGAPHI_001174 [Ogataea philodendri]|uniref:GYF domain-containing protein n=1 Tax=Ogataea philodendri TaxID=1378263 RepID=A0A9P8PFS6_9ASCO|nr:uncharacterized protein OGAPHI_001174 [Ogataea philodendri]KAH3670659.1 hypothetical protein OGAPHI_001174 [Ogataea philodendri]